MAKALAAALVFFSTFAHAQGIDLRPPTHWGFEGWWCGKYIYKAQLGNGTKDVLITHINGLVTASSTSPKAITFKQSLTVLDHNPPAPTESTASPPPYGGNNNEVDHGAFMINAKLVGNSVAHIPFSIPYNPPLLSIKGNLTATITDGSATQFGGPDCINTEVHLTIQWGYKVP